MNKIANYIELPRDKFGNIGFVYKNRPCVIRAEEIPGTGTAGTWESVARLNVLEPADFTWPSLTQQDAAGGHWVEVSASPGPISDALWANLVLDIPDLPEWMYEAARRRAVPPKKSPAV